MKNIAVVYKKSKPETRQVLAQVVEFLLEADCSLQISNDLSWNHRRVKLMPEGEIVNNADALVVLGGDGTLIHAAHLLDGRDVPVLGINLGQLGFLTEIPTNEIETALDRMLSGDFETTERRMLRVSLLRSGEEIFSRTVLNDMVINKGALARIIRLEASTTQGLMTSYRADGLIVSTPTGSTAYNMSAGGPVVYPTLDAFVITPICPHTFANRPVVLPDDIEIFIELAEANGEVYLTLDGQEGVQMLEGDRVAVRRALLTVKLIRSHLSDYFNILRHKLGWGQC